MADTRMIKTVIWEDDWFFDLSDKAQRLYLYLLTNKNTEISGFYKLPMREIEMYTKYKETVLIELFKEIYPKIAYADGWVIIPKYTEHQNVANNAKVQISIEKALKKIPPHILNIKSEIINQKSAAMHSLSMGYLKEEKKPDKVLETKDIYGEFKNVKLTKDEWGKLGDKLGTMREDMIEELSTGIASKGYKYTSHYATILSWSRKKGIKPSEKSKYDD